MQSMVKGALWNTFKWDWIASAFFAIVGESTGVFACYFISYLIKYLQDEEAPVEEGAYLLAIFCSVSII